MVDIDDIDDGEDSGSGSKSTKSSSSSGGSVASGSVDETPDAYTQSAEDSPMPGSATVSDVSKEWKNDHSELNYKPKRGESEKQYVKRQVKECTEFYDNYLDIVDENLDSIEKFAL